MCLNVSLSTCFDTGNEGDGSETHLNFEKGKTESLGLFFIWPLGLVLVVTVTKCANVRYYPLQVTCHGLLRLPFFLN